jgi:hypothetical protein
VRRGLLAIVDRGGSSLGSLILISLVATSTTAANFGRFAFLMALSIAAQTAYRAVPGSWLVVTDRLEGRDSVPRAAVFVALNVAIASAVVILAAGVLTGVPRPLSLAVAAQCAAVVVADTPRLASYGARNAVRPALLTTCTLALFALAIGTWTLAGRPGGAYVPVTAYALSIAIPGITVLALRRTHGSERLYAYIRANRRDVGGQMTSAASSAAAQVMVPTFLQVLTGPALVGAVRGAQSLAAVPGQLPTALQPVLLADTSHKRTLGLGAGHNLLRWTVMVTALFAVATVVAVALPYTLGVRFFGASWKGIDQALVGILVSTWATCCLIAVEASYRVQHRMSRFSSIRVVGLVLVCLGAIIGAQVDGASGAAWGLALANTTVLVVAVAGRPEEDPPASGGTA